MSEEKDRRFGHKVIKTITLEDQGQDFTELDLLDNGIILGNNIMFAKGRLSLLGIGTENGEEYASVDTLIDLENEYEDLDLDNFSMYVYIKDTDVPDPLPWKAVTLKYRVTGITSDVWKPDRFLKE